MDRGRVGLPRLDAILAGVPLLHRWHLLHRHQVVGGELSLGNLLLLQWVRAVYDDN